MRRANPTTGRNGERGEGGVHGEWCSWVVGLGVGPRSVPTTGRLVTGFSEAEEVSSPFAAQLNGYCGRYNRDVINEFGDPRGCHYRPRRD